MKSMPSRLRLASRRYSLPFRAPVRTGHGVWAERTGVLVRLTDEAGRTGYGEAAPIPWFGTETADEVDALLKSLGEWVTPVQLDAVPERFGCACFALAAALEGAGADSQKKHEGRAHLPVAALLPAGRAALAQVAEKAEMGFRVFKWKVGAFDLADELSLLDDLVAELPEGARLRLDANGAWDRRQAERWLERAAERPVEFVEQPVAPTMRGADDVLRGLAADYPVTLALDESLAGACDVERWLAAEWRGVFVVKPALFGDPRPVLARLAAAKADVVFSSALETAVGARAALRAAFAWAGFPEKMEKTGKPRALGFGVWPLFEGTVFNGPRAVPFLRMADVEALDEEAAWNALS